MNLISSVPHILLLFCLSCVIYLYVIVLFCVLNVSAALYSVCRSVNVFKGQKRLRRIIVLLYDNVWIAHLLMLIYSTSGSNVYVHGIAKSPTVLKEESQDGGCAVLEDIEPPPELASPVRSVDEASAACAHFVERDTGQSECSSAAAAVKTEKTISSEEPPYFQEQW